jgi:hypothetical protein
VVTKITHLSLVTHVPFRSFFLSLVFLHDSSRPLLPRPPSPTSIPPCSAPVDARRSGSAPQPRGRRSERPRGRRTPTRRTQAGAAPPRSLAGAGGSGLAGAGPPQGGHRLERLRPVASRAQVGAASRAQERAAPPWPCVPDLPNPLLRWPPSPILSSDAPSPTLYPARPDLPPSGTSNWNPDLPPLPARPQAARPTVCPPAERMKKREFMSMTRGLRL